MGSHPGQLAKAQLSFSKHAENPKTPRYQLGRWKYHDSVGGGSLADIPDGPPDILASLSMELLWAPGANQDADFPPRIPSSAEEAAFQGIGQVSVSEQGAAEDDGAAQMLQEWRGGGRDDGWQPGAGQPKLPGSPAPPKKEKRRVGRPIAYHGDPNAQHLTPAERRRMRRRIANRESARRVRARCLDEVNAMASKAAELEAGNAALAREIKAACTQCSEIAAEAANIAQRDAELAGSNYALEAQLAQLRLAAGNTEAGGGPQRAGTLASEGSGLLPPLEALVLPLGPYDSPLYPATQLFGAAPNLSLWAER